jgi:hypothetical protein
MTLRPSCSFDAAGAECRALLADAGSANDLVASCRVQVQRVGWNMSSM